MSVAAPVKTLLLVGPTASGKTTVAHHIASAMPGSSILSADAMMIYRGMDVGTAKPTDHEISTYRYAGVNLADPDQTFSVHDYLSAVRTEAPWRIVVGGTGLYFRGLLRGLDGGAGESVELRAEAERVLARDDVEGLKSWCRLKCPGIDGALPAGDLGNPRRWIRAVERQSSSTPAVEPVLSPEACVIVGIARDRLELERRIRVRVESMYRCGLIEEARALRSRYAALSATAGKAIGYAEAYDVLDGRTSMSEAMERTVVRTRQYAKRQMTWFRNQLDVCWVEVAEDESLEHVSARVMKVLCEQR